MKILFTGGGTGGHLYPIIAVIESLRALEQERNLVDLKLYYAGDAAYNGDFFYNNQVKVKKVRTGKRRGYFSLLNFFDIFKTAFSCLSCTWYLFTIFPDVVFGKGGAVSFPILFAARFLGIPVMIHESDSSPGRTNLWASKFAKAIAISYPAAAESFPKEKTVLTGNPIRNEILVPIEEGAHEFLNLRDDVPIIAVFGGSQGAQKINDAIYTALPKLLERYQVIHQVGEKNVALTEALLGHVLETSPYKERYRYFGHLNDLALKMSVGATDLIISRAGSTIFEIAIWKKPSIIIPIRKSNGNHQVKNAYYYARSGAATVIEEENLSPNLLISEIDHIMTNPALQTEMINAAENFSDIGAASKIAKKLLSLAEHRKD